jgi:hypothetical protein
MDPQTYYKNQVKALAVFLRRNFPEAVKAEEARGEDGKSAVELSMALLKEYASMKKEQPNDPNIR